MKYVIGVFVAVVLMILAIIAIVRRDSSPATPDMTDNSAAQVDLSEYEQKPASVSYQVSGPVVAAEDRRTIRITISAESRVVEVIEGYNDRVIKSQRFNGSRRAFSDFLAALKGAGFANENKTSIDERSVCPLGRRYVFKLQDGSQQVFRTWSTSCGSKTGSFSGNLSTIRRLFEKQIPDYSTIVRGVRF